MLPEKSLNFEFFSKKSVQGVKNENFEKPISNLKSASKNTYKRRATGPQRRFSKKFKILSF